MSTPGQDRFEILRPWILNNANGFVFVYDPTVNHNENLKAFKEIYESKLPKVIQINKVDLTEQKKVEEIKRIFKDFTTIEAVAKDNKGVKETFQAILREILR